MLDPVGQSYVRSADMPAGRNERPKTLPSCSRRRFIGWEEVESGQDRGLHSVWKPLE